jgi:hypothetical protein
MRVLTDRELARRADCELAVLFQIAAEALAHTAPGTPARHDAIASLQNISRERARRHRRNRTPGL